MKEKQQNMASDGVQIDLVRDEILTTRATISLEVPAEADSEFVARAVGVRGVDGQVRATRGAGRCCPPAAIQRPGGGRRARQTDAVTDEARVVGRSGGSNASHRAGGCSSAKCCPRSDSIARPCNNARDSLAPRTSQAARCTRA